MTPEEEKKKKEEEEVNVGEVVADVVDVTSSRRQAIVEIVSRVGRYLASISSEKCVSSHDLA